MRVKALIAAMALSALSAGALAAASELPAQQLFSKTSAPSASTPRPIGSYARGCLAGAQALPLDGPHWQVMRLSRNRNWGHPELISYIERFSEDAAKEGWNGLLVGDLAQPRGGPMASGHASHQIGLDVDIWLDPMPDRTLSTEEREESGATSYIKPGTNVELDKKGWTEAHSRLIRRAASYPEVERIFVNPGIKKELCDWAGTDRAWLRKVRPWYKHDDHFHIRLRCPSGMAGCSAQDPTAAGDGCGDNLAWWLNPDRYRPAKGPIKYAPELTLADLPAACTGVLTADPGGLPAAALKVRTPLPRLRPEIN